MAKILLIDAEENIRITVGNIIREEGHELSPAENTAQAFQLMKENNYDVIVSGIITPKVSLIELLKRGRETFSDIPIIMMIGAPTLESVTDFLRAGAFDYLPKPVSREDLRRVLPRAVKMKQLEEENKRYQENLGKLVKERSAELYSLNEKLQNEIEVRMEAGARLEESEEKFRSVFEYSPLGKSMTEIDGSLKINKSFCDILGYSEKELKTKKWQDLTHPDDISKNLEMVQDLLNGKNNKVNFEKRYLHKNGSVVWADVITALKRDKDNKPEYFITSIQDITDRKEREEQLKISEKRLQEVLDLSPFPIAVVDEKDDNIFYWSKSARQLFGYDPKTTQEWYKLAYPDPNYRNDVIQCWKPFLEIAEKTSEAVNTGEYRIVCKDGSTKICEIYAQFIPGNLIVTLNNITERKQGEEKLKISEKKYRDLINLAQEGIWVIDKNNITIFSNPSLAKMLGYSQTEMIGKSLFDFMDEKGARIANENLERRKAGLKEQHDFEFICKNGGRIYCTLVTSPILDNNGNYEGAIAGIIDITKRKQSEELTKKNQSLLKQAEGISNQGAWEWDIDQDVWTFSENWLRIHGCQLSGIKHKELMTIAYPADAPKVEKAFQDALKGITPYDLEHRIVRQNDGEVRHVKALGDFILNDSGQKVKMYGITRDITPQKAAEEKEIELMAQLQQVQKLESIGVLAAGVAHEINNPLMGMINYADIIQEKVEDIQLKEFAGCIMDEGNRIGAIVQNLLSFSSQDKQNHSPASISDIINKSLSLTAAVLRKHQIIFLQDIPEDLPPIKCRSQQIQQVILNLLTNATFAVNEKYDGYHDDKIIKIIVKPIIKENVSYLRITVEDHGIGIGDDIIDHIFDPFFSTKGRAHGTGLGLSISYGIVNEHRGVLSVETKIGEYTRFHMDLPVDGGEVYEGSDVKNRFPNETKAEE